MRAILFLLLRLAVLVIQMAGLLAYFSQYLGWSSLASMIVSVLLVAFLPLAATVLGFIGALKVWLWPWWLALIVFLPGLALSLAALVGVGTAGILGALFFKRRLQRFQRGTGGPFQRGPFYTGGDTSGQPGGQQGPLHGEGRQDHAGGSGSTIEGEVLSSRVDNDARD